MENKPTTTAEPKFDQKDIDENKVMACLSYVGILFLIPMLAKKDSRFCQENAKQGIVMFIAGLLAAIPVIGWIWLGVVVVVDVIAIINVLQGKFWKIPGAYDFSRKFNF
ncbi:MAG: hypothetical protein ACD_43C00030G0004 [uncultured bacterium]|nr:MAG: hypothetical protein ACD_43C00030G0004 [uncultured bacterium]